ncbi:MAG TPA: hypothetical protein VL326_02355 [Kofleriaceae bacterium]|nr:hypothetical protein [Kofleriaceae bacterium]
MSVRFVIFLFGIVLGVAGTLAYGMFVVSGPGPLPTPVATHAPVTVTLDESFLTALMQRAIADAPATKVPGVDVSKTRVRAELRGDMIVVHASVNVLGAPTEGTVSMRPVLRNGRLAIDVVETNLGAIALPAMDQVLDKQINARVQSLLDGMPVTVTGVGVDPGRGLAVTCQVDLDRLETQTSPQAAR